MTAAHSVLTTVVHKIIGNSLFGRVLGFDPVTQMRVVTYQLTPRGWPSDLRLRVAVISDLHACEPWMNVARIRHICERANALEPDIILLLGDYVKAVKLVGEPIPPAVWAAELARLKAPLGIHAVLGNHDWDKDPEAIARQAGPTAAGEALSSVGIPVYENQAKPIVTDAGTFWLAGLSDLRSITTKPGTPERLARNLADLSETLEQVTTDDPIVLMAHEPDIFARMPDRVSLTVSGHTHGGQVRLFGRAYVVPSEFGERYAYGHIREDGRDLIVSGGLGCSGVPIRFAMPPELTLIELGNAL